MMQEVGFKPVNGYLLVSVEEDSGEIEGDGVVLYKPSTAKQAQPHGKVVRGNEEFPTGCRVLFVRHAGKYVVLDGVQYQLLRNTEIYGIVGDDVSVS